jgi:hypothetical protein
MSNNAIPFCNVKAGVFLPIRPSVQKPSFLQASDQDYNGAERLRLVCVRGFPSIPRKPDFHQRLASDKSLAGTLGLFAWQRGLRKTRSDQGLRSYNRLIQ